MTEEQSQLPSANGLVPQDQERDRQQLTTQHGELQRLFALVERAKQEWEQILDCLDTLVVFTDVDGRILRCNHAVADLLGRPLRELIGQPIGLLLAAFDGPPVTCPSTCVHAQHSGSDRWFALSCFPLQLGGEALGEVITAQDITAIKRANHELEQQRRELEDAYAQLKQSQSTILQQEKMASVGMLAAGVAHEINNPIGFVTSNLHSLEKYLAKLTEFIELQQGLPLPKPLQQRLDEARKRLQLEFVLEDCRDLVAESLEGTGRVQVIVQGLKNFSRVDQAEVKPVDLNECLDATIRIVWNEIKYKSQLEREFGPLPLVCCNAQQLNQVFMNLLVNAAQAIEQNGLIRVNTRQVGVRVQIAISDNGCGIPPENLPRIFEPFFTTKPVGKGTGLGMSIAYDIVSKHGGAIAVESEVGSGTTFTVSLPLTPAAAG